MRSLKFILPFLAAILFPILAQAGSVVHMSRDTQVTAVNPLGPEDLRDFVAYGGTCTVPFGERISKLMNDDLMVVVFIDGKPKARADEHCPLGTVFRLKKDDFAKMELDFLLSTRARVEEELKATSDEAQKKYSAMGMTGEKLRMAILLDPASLEKRAVLELTRALIVHERVSIRERRKFEAEIAAVTD